MTFENYKHKHMKVYIILFLFFMPFLALSQNNTDKTAVQIRLFHKSKKKRISVDECAAYLVRQKDTVLTSSSSLYLVDNKDRSAELIIDYKNDLIKIPTKKYLNFMKSDTVYINVLLHYKNKTACYNVNYGVSDLVLGEDYNVPIKIRERRKCHNINFTTYPRMHGLYLPIK